MFIENLLKRKPFNTSVIEREKILLKGLIDLTNFHYNNCSEYKKILDSYSFDIKEIKNINDIPFIPVRLFKNNLLKSVSNNNIFKILNSSGTSGQNLSKIVLDKYTSNMQTKILSNITSSIIGSKRLPMVILDTQAVLKNNTNFSARGAGILGFSLFGKDKLFIFNEDMNLEIESLITFLKKHKNKKILMFGFTYIIWEYFYKSLKKINKKIDLSNVILIHGGGWKKLNDKSVTNKIFNNSLKKEHGIKKIYNYYGMVEQTGSIYLECREGYYHSSIYSDVIIRDQNNLNVCPLGKKGIIQVMSLIPKSYPGHSLITEDEGELFGYDNCQCGRSGKFFKIYGRLKEAEIRGCSDTYE